MLILNWVWDYIQQNQYYVKKTQNYLHEVHKVQKKRARLAEAIQPQVLGAGGLNARAKDPYSIAIGATAEAANQQQLLWALVQWQQALILLQLVL
ncbi:hypothetical protein AVJ24_20725 [Yersinia pestis]|nr:hypothetical protein AVJ24_20725 [Yersinia pestis]